MKCPSRPRHFPHHNMILRRRPPRANREWRNMMTLVLAAEIPITEHICNCTNCYTTDVQSSPSAHRRACIPRVRNPARPRARVSRVTTARAFNELTKSSLTGHFIKATSSHPRHTRVCLGWDYTCTLDSTSVIALIGKPTGGYPYIKGIEGMRTV